MGTRSTITFYDQYKDNEGEKVNIPLVTIFQMFDGYFSGVGHTLANFLKEKKIINGIGTGDTIEAGYANGMGCLAAQFIAAEKTDLGGLYIVKSEEFNGYYDYKVYLNKDTFLIEVGDFKGSPEDLLNYNETNMQ